MPRGYTKPLSIESIARRGSFQAKMYGRKSPPGAARSIEFAGRYRHFLDAFEKVAPRTAAGVSG